MKKLNDFVDLFDYWIKITLNTETKIHTVVIEFNWLALFVILFGGLALGLYLSKLINLLLRQ